MTAALRGHLRAHAEVLEPTPHQIRDAAQTVADSGCGRVIVAGGDGTVHQVVNLLAAESPDVEVGIVPLGTGNDLARALGLPLDDAQAAFDLARTGEARPLDLVRVREAGNAADRYLVNISYGGFGGPVAKAVNEDAKARWGVLAYWLEATRRVLDLPVYDAQLDADGTRLALSIHGLLVANGCFIGGGFPAAPDARLDDGAFHVVLVSEQRPLDTIRAALDLLQAQSDAGGQTVTFTARRLELRADPEMEFTCDGEAGPCTPVVFELVPHAVRVVAAPEAVSLAAARLAR